MKMAEAMPCEDNENINRPDSRTAMLDRIANSDAHFKHQQRGEPDLNYREKFDIASTLLDDKPAVFLSRFGSYLIKEDLALFDSLKSDYVIDFHLKDVKQKLDDCKSQTVVRNRRYNAMQKMMTDGTYFSDEEMKARDPLLYEQLVGQYLTDEEREALIPIDKSDLRMSSIITKHMDIVQNNTLYEMQKEVEENQMEESDEESESEEEIDTQSNTEAKPEIDENDKIMLRHELIRTMQLRFLEGKDGDFEYSSVDKNTDYDPLDILGQDAEDKYFDEEDDEILISRASSSLDLNAT